MAETRSGERSPALFATHRMFDGNVFAITPFRPRAPVVAYPRITGPFERDVCVRRAIAALTIGNDLRVGSQTQRCELRAKLTGRLHISLGSVTRGPVAMHGAGNRAAPPGANPLTEILLVAAHVEDLHFGPPESFDQVAGGGRGFITGLALEVRWFDGRSELRQPLAHDCPHPAIEHARSPMSHPFQQPGPARSTHPGVVFVKHYRLMSGDADRRENQLELHAKLAGAAFVGIGVVKRKRIEMARAL